MLKPAAYLSHTPYLPLQALLARFSSYSNIAFISPPLLCRISNKLLSAFGSGSASTPQATMNSIKTNTAIKNLFQSL